MLNLVLFLIFVICVAALWFQGLWSNAITLINMLLAMMLAFNYFEPLATMLDGMERSYTYLWDFLALWGLFAICYGLLRALTDMLSRKRVAFDFWVETVGRSRTGRVDRLAVHRIHLRHDAHGSAGAASAGIPANSHLGQFSGYGPRAAVVGFHAEPVPGSALAVGNGSGQAVASRAG